MKKIILIDTETNEQKVFIEEVKAVIEEAASPFLEKEARYELRADWKRNRVSYILRTNSGTSRYANVQKVGQKSVHVDLPGVIVGITHTRGDAVWAAQVLANRVLQDAKDWAICSEDGFYGPDTARTIKEAQSILGISVDGQCGAFTWAKLINHCLYFYGRESEVKVSEDFIIAGVLTIPNDKAINFCSIAKSENTKPEERTSHTKWFNQNGKSYTLKYEDKGLGFGNYYIALSGGFNYTMQDAGDYVIGYNYHQGNPVKVCQLLLNEYGYGLVADGIHGTKTSNAIYYFQKKFGLGADAYCGRQTWNQLCISLPIRG